MLWSTALGDGFAYVTRLRRGARPDIVRLAW